MQNSKFILSIIILGLLIVLLIHLIVRRKRFWKRNAPDLSAEYKSYYHKNLLQDFENTYAPTLNPFLWFQERLKNSSVLKVKSVLVGKYAELIFRHFRIEQELTLVDFKNKLKREKIWSNYLIVEIPSSSVAASVKFEIRKRTAIPQIWNRILKSFVKNDLKSDEKYQIQLSDAQFIFNFLDEPDQSGMEILKKKRVQDFILDLLEIPLDKNKKIVYRFFLINNFVGIHFEEEEMRRYSKIYPLSHYLEYLSSVAREFKSELSLKNNMERGD